MQFGGNHVVAVQRGSQALFSGNREERGEGMSDAVKKAFEEWWKEFSADMGAGIQDKWFAKQGYKAAYAAAKEQAAELVEATDCGKYTEVGERIVTAIRAMEERG